MLSNITYRDYIKLTDPEAITAVVKSSGYFNDAEITLARELAEDRLNHGLESSYQFLFAESASTLLGYTCYGLIPATTGSYDLYWIAVSEDSRGMGLGKELIKKTEEIIASLGGRRIYVETSSRQQYESTRCSFDYWRPCRG